MNAHLTETKLKTREINTKRRVSYKNRRTYCLSFYIKYLIPRYTFCFENSIKVSHHSECFFIDKIINSFDNRIELTLNDCIEFVRNDSLKYKYQNKPTPNRENIQLNEIEESQTTTSENSSKISKERIDYRDSAVVMMINFLAFSLEYYEDWEFKWNKPKKLGRHLLYTSQLFKSVKMNGKEIKYEKALKEGEEFYRNVIVPILKGYELDYIQYKNHLFLGERKSRNLNKTNESISSLN